MQRQYAKDTVGFAQAFLQNQSGIRSDFQNALDSLKSQFAQLSQQTAQMNQQMAQFQFNRQDAEQARSDVRAQRYQDLAVGVGMLAVGALTGQSAITNGGVTKLGGKPTSPTQAGSQPGGGDISSAIMQAIMSGGAIG